MTEQATAPVPAKGLFARAIGMLFSPRATYEAIVAHPKPVGIMFLAVFVIALTAAGPQFTDTGRHLVVDAQVKASEAGGRTMTADQVAALEKMSQYFAYGAFVSVFILTPLVVMFFTLIYWVIFNAIMGGLATFRQVLAVVSHSMIISAVGGAIGAPIMLAQGKISNAGPFNLGALAAGADPDSFFRHFMGGISIFQIWGIVVTAIGLSVLYRRKTGGIAAVLMLVYLAFTAVAAYFFGRFMA